MTETKVGIVGLGAIGRAVARRLSAGIPGLRLTCAASRDTAKAAAWLAAEAISCPLVELCDFPRHADLVLECAPAAMLEAICTPMLAAGKRVMVLSAGALLPRPHLIDLARQHGGQIIVPTGALLGLDAVAAAAEGTIHSVRMTTRKPPRGLAGAAYLVQNGISVQRNSRSPSGCSPAPPGRPPRGFRKTSMWRRRCRSPASVRTAPPSRYGPIPR